jgi:flagellar biosynthetic protein FliR
MTEVLAIADGLWWQGFVVFLRVAAFCALLPGFGEQSLSVRVKLAAAVAFSAVIAPLAPVAPEPGGAGGVTLLMLAEAAAGLFIGIGVRMLVFALQTAGAIAAQSTSLSQVLGGVSADPQPAMGFVLVVGAIALAMMTGLHVKAVQLLVVSYEILPLGQFPGPGVVADLGVKSVGRAFSLAFSLAAPFVILSVVYNLALGAINKAMPQLMVAFVGAPVITLGGLVLLALSAPLMLGAWLRALDGFLAMPFGAP